MRSLFGLLFVLIVSVFGVLDAHAQNWLPTGVNGVKYDKDRISKMTAADTFSVWFWSEGRDRVGGLRVIGVVSNFEIDCYLKKMRSIASWWVLENRSLKPWDPSPPQEDDFGDFDLFLSSTVCKQANEFYKKAAPQQR